MKFVIFLFLLAVVGCQTPQKKIETFSTPKGYKAAFNESKSYFVRCAKGVHVRANLFTDIPEAEIVIDYLPGATAFVSGGIVTSSSSGAKELVNIHFKGMGKMTEVSTHSKLSRLLAQRSLSNGPCPTQEEIGEGE